MVPPKLTVVGHCTSNTARILCCIDRKAAGARPVARLVWRAAGSTGFSDVPLNAALPYEIGVFDLVGLPDGADVTYVIVIGEDHPPIPAAEELLRTPAAHRFRLLPTHRPPRVALVSCNGAFEVDDPQRRYAMWRVLRRQIEAGDVDLIVHAGDQVYADSLVDRCSKMARAATDPDAAVQALTEEYRRLYVEQSWTTPDVAAVLTSCPSVMMWDDHDIDDGWGSNDEDDQGWRRLFFAAARQAFIEFQVSLNPPAIDTSSFACGFSHGDLAFLLLDGRSHRLYKEGRVLGTGQLEVARKWLEAQPATLRRLYLVLGIPPVHAKMATIFAILKWLPIHEDFASDLRDAWVSPNNRGECTALMDVLVNFLATHPGTDLTILAGDVHVASIGRLERLEADGQANRRSLLVWQVTSSGIGSPPPKGLSGWVVEKVTRSPVDLGAAIQGRLIPVAPDGNDVLLRRNFAVLRLDDGDAWHGERLLRLSLFAEGLPEPLEFRLPSRPEA